MIYKLLLVVNIVVAVAAQVFVKLGMKKVGPVQFDANIIDKLKKMVASPYLWVAVFVYFISFTLYAIILSKVELNRAYPVALIGGIILTFIMSVVFFHESINSQQVIGLVLCVIGFIFLFRAF